MAGCFASTGLQVRAEVLEMFRQDFVGGRLRVVAGLAMLDCSRPVRKQLKDNQGGNSASTVGAGIPNMFGNQKVGVSSVFQRFCFLMVDKMASILFCFPMVQTIGNQNFWLVWTVLYKLK